MKKLFLIASFSMAMLANANENKEVEFNNSIKVELNNDEQTTTSDAFFYGCGSAGNVYYNELREAGMDHRGARSERRDFVRDCRGGKWWEVCVMGVCI